MKTYTIAGISTHEGKTKLRASNVKNYASVLKSLGHTNIQLFPLPREMSRDEAFVFVQERVKVDFIPPVSIQLAEKGSASRTRKPSASTAKPVSDIDDPDGDFVEPTDERIQVKMCYLARENPGLTGAQLYRMVMEQRN
jgi:hypothetical protein